MALSTEYQSLLHDDLDVEETPTSKREGTNRGLQERQYAGR